MTESNSRQYTKRHTKFCQDGGKQESARNVPQLLANTEDDDDLQTQMSPQYSESELRAMKVPQLRDILEVEVRLSVGKGKRKQELIEMICQFHARSQYI